MRKRNLLVSLLSFVLLAATCTAGASAKSTPDWDKELAKGYQDLSIGNKEKAAEFFAKKVSKYPNSGACHTALGKALKRLGKLDEAKKEFRSATQCDPTFAEGFYEFGSSLESDQQYKEAIDCFQKYLELSTDAARRKNIEDRIRFCQDKL
jgi:tetratricopeptide (TPR) repeat protein